ncbi:(Fe-S)-binding protein, partial [Undibacterium sp. LFS511W]
TFSLKHPAISGAMVMDKLAALRATSCQGVVTADCGCLLNLRHAAEYQQQPVRIEHMASFLWRRTNAADAAQTDLPSAQPAGEPV